MNETVDPFLPPMVKSDGGLAPEAPTSVKTIGLDRSILLDLALKTAHLLPQFSTESAARRMHLSIAVTADLLEQMRTEFLLEALGHEGPGYRYAITQRGRERAERLMEICGYVGPAPVSLESYRAMLEWQAAQSPRITPEQIKAALAELVLPEEAMEIAGLAMASGRSLFLSGPPGNGKTSLGRMLHNAAAGGDLWIPHCIAVDNNIIRLFDPHCHHPVAHAALKHHPIDQRWIKIHRPFIVAGGEMTLESLDMAWLPALKYYEAPLHMKANGGTFLIDDFGRQHVAPAELLNRWIIPLEHRIDFLTLHTGQKIQVPFLLMLVIATNLDPKDVTDPAFLRRLGYRLTLHTPTPDFYTQVFEQYAARCGLTVDRTLIPRLLDRYRATNRELRCCEPRDLIERVRDICSHHGQIFALNDKIIDLAWRGYFGSEPTGS